MKTHHLLLAVLITAIWGMNFSVIKLGLLEVDPFILAGLRFLLCALPALFFIAKPDVKWRWLIGYGLVFGVGLWGMVNLAIRLGLSAGVASLLLQFSALFTLVLGGWVFREPLSRYQWAGIAIALTGLLCIIFLTDGSVSLPGLGCVLVAAVAWSVANILYKKADTRQVFAFLIWSSLFAPIPLFILAYAVNGWSGFHGLLAHTHGITLLSILFQAYPNTLFGYWVWNALLKRYPVSTVAPLSLLVPVFGLLGSFWIFDEPLSALKLAALLIIISGLSTGLYGARLRQAWRGRTVP
ncbi:MULTISPECIES: EamA family transporter [Pantoea]|uniref:EamA family transporter n=1 Tax=Pantoea TaxID=53335 RepID=UPI001F32D6D7|nr:MULTISPECIES: EamA family transporter [Pantoea]UIL54988.1 EamA family transporter [Pantoea agglomerans]